jgi:hypothetical protein
MENMTLANLIVDPLQPHQWQISIETGYTVPAWASSVAGTA